MGGMANLLHQQIEDDRFVNGVADDLKCPICFNLLADPMQCVKNEHLFCKPCITRYLRNTQRCPSCIEPLTMQSLRPSRLARVMVSQLLVRCENFAQGCQENIKLDALEHHITNCEFKMVQCGNEGCDVNMTKRNQQHHETEECNYRLVPCQVCGTAVRFTKQSVHCFVTRQELGQIKESLKNTQDEMREIKQHVEDLGTGMRQLFVISTDIARMNNKITGVVNAVGEMRNKIGAMEGMVNSLRDEVAAVKHEFRTFGGAQRINDAEFYSDIIIVGGTGVNTTNPRSSVERFSFSARRWTAMPETTSSRWFSSSFVYKEELVVHGGFTSNSIEALNLTRIGEGWKMRGQLPRQLLGHASILYKDCVFIIGGQTDNEEVFNIIYKMVLENPYSFTVRCAMREPRSHHGAVLYGGKVIIVGGVVTGLSTDCINKVAEYDITRNTVQQLPSLPYAVSEMATVLWKDSVLVVGGLDNEAEALDCVLLYDIPTGRSTMLTPMKEKRSRCSAVITNNLLIVMGGWNDTDGNLKTVESYNFDVGCWENFPSMNEFRQAATATLL